MPAEPQTAEHAACGLWYTRGRRYEETDHLYRSPFQRDRDRVIHSRAFRRLENKTQVFSHPLSDHFRTRLTHTLEVAQISRTVALATGLNSDLVETLALAHDLGHPPFGHAGEHALDALMRPFGMGFDHNLQALRIVEDFERRYAAFPGLNLTFEVREGLVKHSHDYTPASHPELVDYDLDLRPPLEAQLIDLTDEIAYSTADLDDGLESKLLSLEQMLAVPVLARTLAQVESEYGSLPPKLRGNEMLRRVVDHFATDLIANLLRIIPGFASVTQVRAHPRRLAAFTPAVEQERVEVKAFLHRNLYRHRLLHEENERAEAIVTAVFHRLLDDREALPPHYRARAGREAPERVICDYIAGMTDSFITDLHQRLQTRPIPRPVY
ncbi:MAG: deoxyguanosinetriphosphate triphosphohydrolase [Terriglobales bacterium]